MQRLPSPYQQHAAIRQSLSPDPGTPSEFEGSPTWPGRDAETEYVSETTSYDHHDTNDGDEKKTGTYIWRTVGDSKVRSAHAERNGKTYSWDDPPEGGHPGEAPNCRCRAEDVNLNSCEHLRAQLEVDSNNYEAARKRQDKANERVNEISAQLTGVREGMSVIVKNVRVTYGEAVAALLGSRPPIGVSIKLASLFTKYVDLEFDHADLDKQLKEAAIERELIRKYEVEPARSALIKTQRKLEEQDCKN